MGPIGSSLFFRGGWHGYLIKFMIFKQSAQVTASFRLVHVAAFKLIAFGVVAHKGETGA